jgi:MoaA/NifB/PqqE/SkfB family radical SAM enzyme
MANWQEQVGKLSGVRERVSSVYEESELKTRVDASVTELTRRAKGSLAKRVLDPIMFGAPADADLPLRTSVLRKTGLTQELKIRNEHHNERDIKKARAEVTGYPEHLQIAVTTQCNLRCKMCALTAEGKDYVGEHANPQLFKNIEPILPFVSTIKLQGTGEPFLYPGMKEACELGMKHGVRLITVTNATIITDEIARMAGPAFSEIYVSIDAAHPDTYKRIRCGGKLEQVWRGVEFLNKYRNPNLRLGFAFTIMKDNVHELPDFVRMAKRYNAQLVRASWMVAFNELPWTFTQEPTAHPELMARWFEEARAVGDELGIRVEVPPVVVPEPSPPPPPRPKRVVSLPGVPAAPKTAPTVTVASSGVLANLHGRRVRGTCSLMYQNAYIHQDSQVAPCCYLKGRVGSLEKTDFRSVWNGEAMVSLRREFNSGTLPNSCTRCAYLRMGRIGDGALVDVDAEQLS